MAQVYEYVEPTAAEIDASRAAFPACLICGAQAGDERAIGSARRKDGTRIEFDVLIEREYALRERRTDAIIGYQCQACFDRD